MTDRVVRNCLQQAIGRLESQGPNEEICDGTAVTNYARPYDADGRAASTVVGYVLVLGIVTLLVTGLLFAGTDFVSDQREETVRNELRVLGQQLADDLAAADRLVLAGDGSTEVTVARDFPEEVTGSSYTLEVVPGGGPPTTIVLTAPDPGVRVEVDVWVETTVPATTVEGGQMEIVYTGSALEVQNG